MPIDSLLQSLTGAAPLQLQWDSDDGTVWGDDAERSRPLVGNYVGKPYGVPSRYPPETLRIVCPLRRPSHMAVRLGANDRLPPELDALYPLIDDGDDTPPNAVS